MPYPELIRFVGRKRLTSKPRVDSFHIHICRQPVYSLVYEKAMIQKWMEALIEPRTVGGNRNRNLESSGVARIK